MYYTKLAVRNHQTTHTGKRIHPLAIVFFAVVLMVFAVFWLPRLGKPFFGHHEFNGVFFGQIARNYVRYGLIATKGAQVLNPGTQPKSNWSLHTHHPATYPLALGAVFATLGVSETAERSLSLIASLIALILLIRLTKSTSALLPLLVTPLFLYYAIIPVFEPVILPFIVLILLAYAQKNPRLLLFASLAGILIDWPAFWFIGWIICVEVFSKNRNWHLIRAAIFGIIAGTLVNMLHLWLIVGDPIGPILDIGLYRASGMQQPFTSVEWIRLLISRTKAFIGLPLILSSIAGTVVAFRYKKQWKLVLVTLLPALTHVIFFRNVTWYHDYVLYYSLPFIAVATSVCLWYSYQVTRSPIKVFGVAVVLAIATFVTTYPFYRALASLHSHDICVKSQTLSAEAADQCGVFQVFYSDDFGR